MNTVIDSGKWTGEVRRDPYRVLTARERTGEVRFELSRSIGLTSWVMIAASIAVGGFLIGAEFQGHRFTGRDADMLNLPVWKAVLGFLILSFAARLVPARPQRMADRRKFVPLIIDDNAIRFGDPQQYVLINKIKAVSTPGATASLSELTDILSYESGTSSWDRNLTRPQPVTTSAPTLALTLEGCADPVRLDLTMLNEFPSRIALIICDRVQKYQSLTGIKNA